MGDLSLGPDADMFRYMESCCTGASHVFYQSIGSYAEEYNGTKSKHSSKRDSAC